MKDEQQGFSIVEGLLVLLVAVVLGLAGWYVYQAKYSAKPVVNQQKVVSTSLTDADSGKTISLHVKDSLTLTLNSTYWQVAGSSDPQVMFLYLER